MIDDVNDNFLRDGLRFECQKCGACCIGKGWVYLAEIDILSLMEGLDITREELEINYLVKNVGMYLLAHRSDDRCIFLEEDKCIVHDFKPYQCKSFPFWRIYIRSRENWDNASRRCVGINKGKLHSQAEVLSWIINNPLPFWL